MSALPPEADMLIVGINVPQADILRPARSRTDAAAKRPATALPPGRGTGRPGFPQ